MCCQQVSNQAQPLMWHKMSWIATTTCNTHVYSAVQLLHENSQLGNTRMPKAVLHVAACGKPQAGNCRCTLSGIKVTQGSSSTAVRKHYACSSSH